MSNLRSLFIFLPFLLFLCGCQVLQEIDKGLTAATNAVTEKDPLTGKRVVNLDDRKEQIAKGDKVIEAMLREADAQGQPYNEKYDPVAYARIQRIFGRIHAVSHFREETWTPVLIPHDAFNAYTTGGTYFVVLSGLEKALTDDNELAAVIAHEVAHTVAGHGAESRSLQVFGAIAKSNTAKRDSFKTAFGHQQEREADDIGILYAALAGFDPYGAHRVWNNMATEMGAAVGYTYGHPHNIERAKFTRETADKVTPYYQSGVRNPDFEAILASNSLWKKEKSRPDHWLTSSLEAYTDALNKKSQARSEENRQRLRSLQLQTINSKRRQIPVLPHRLKLT